jgi:DNA-binding YbaB/EbfC family protein
VTGEDEPLAQPDDAPLVPEVLGAGDGDPPPATGAGGLDLGELLAAATQAAEQVAAAQASLLDARVEGTAGGGVVRVVLNGHLHLLQVDVDPAAVDPDDPSMIGDLVVAAFADAQQQVAELQRQHDPMAGLGDLGGLLGGG